MRLSKYVTDENIRNLELNKVYKNYKEVCAAIGIEPKTGDIKAMQYTEMSRRCAINRKGNTYIVSSFYDKNMTYEDVIWNLPNFKPIRDTDQTLYWGLQNEKNDIRSGYTDITRIEDGLFWWNCYECENIVYASALQRYVNPYNYKDKRHTCPYCESSINAKKIYDIFLDREIKVATEYSFYDLEGVNEGELRFDFAVLDDDDELLGLIEYDGEFHDEDLNPDKENWKIQNIHDNLKNEYCKNNSIPLLRIRHDDFDGYEKRVIEFLDRECFNIPEMSVEEKQQAELEFLREWVVELENRMDRCKCNVSAVYRKKATKMKKTREDFLL